MASLNVAEWSPDQVADWLSGLGPTVARYIPGLRKQKLDGAKLLTLRCDDLEYLGMHVIGHQELLLEAVEHLRNFQYEARRECVQQLALHVSVVGGALARALRHQPDARLDTQALADVARTVRAVKPLVCWLDRWPALGAGLALAERKAALLKLSLEAATCAQRERFAEQPARAVAAAAASAAATADYIIQDVSDPMILQPASLDAVSLRQGERPLGFDVVPSFCGHHQLADIRFGSPAHASGLVHDGDEIVHVAGRCVVGWSGEAVVEACRGVARRPPGDLPLRLRRRAARPPPALATPRLQRLQRLRPAGVRRVHVDLTLDRYESSLRRAAEAREAAEAPARAASPSSAASSSDSEPLSPPASPTHLHLSHTRMYPPKPRALVQRRHTISCGSPVAKRPALTIDQFWQQLREQRWQRGAGSATASPEPDDGALYRRDKALSCSTGLERSPRPRTCLPALPARGPAPPPGPGPAPPPGPAPAPPPGPGAAGRGKLDKSHSTPAYDFGGPTADEPGPLVTQIIPESPTTPTDSPTILVHSAEKADQILDFKKSSSAIGEAILQQQSRRAAGDDNTEFPFGEDPPAAPPASPPASPPEPSDTQRVLETINIAMLEHRRRSALETRASADRPSDRPADRPSDRPDLAHLEQLKLVATRLHQRSPGERAPAPPPRPAATLRGPAAPGPVPAAPAPGPGAPPPRSPPAPSYPVLRAVPRPSPAPAADYSPFKLARHIDTNQISLPLRHITKHDIKVIPSDRRDLPAINSEPEPAASPAPPPGPASPLAAGPAPARDGDVLLSPAHGPSATGKSIFPSSKSRSLKKKSSMLAKRRQVPARALAGRGAVGGVWQRVRARGAPAPRWARRTLLLAHNTLYAYRSPEGARADCMIYLSGFTVSEASEVKSRSHAFKVYHTGTAFYFACDSRDAMTTWITLLTRATLLPALRPEQTDISKQFSETDYSETESDNESPEKRSEREREREKDKDKSKFGSLKKLTVRMQRSESHENVGQSAAASLDRKYLRFFSRHRKDSGRPAKSKQSGVPVPTEHYRSYRRVGGRPSTPPAAPPAAPDAGPAAAPASAPATAPPPERAKIPKPINYIHASNPNLLDFEKSDFVTKPALQPPKPKTHKPENLIGFVTLEEFMLKKQEEERRQVYTNRVLMGVERDRDLARGRRVDDRRVDDRRVDDRRVDDLRHRLHKIVPDVIYGELPSPQCQPSRGAADGKPISVRGADGYEKIVYPEELAEAGVAGVGGGSGGVGHAGGGVSSHGPHAAHTPPAERWRDSLRRNDKVHSAAEPRGHGPAPLLDSWSGGGAGGGGAGGGGVGGGGAVAASGVAAEGGAGVSRLRLMFGGRPHAQCAPSRPQYPHLQCPPTFQPETYSLARLAPGDRDRDRDRDRDLDRDRDRDRDV